MKELLLSIYFTSLLIYGTVAIPRIVSTPNPSRPQGCRLQIVCEESGVIDIKWFRGGTQNQFTNGEDILINTILGRSELTFLRLPGLQGSGGPGPGQVDCTTPTGTAQVTVNVEEPIELTEIPDLRLDRYVEGQGYFVPCTVRSCVWPVQLEWEKDSNILLGQTLTGEETGELSKRTGLLDTTLDRDSTGSYRCVASVQTSTIIQEFTMSGVVRSPDL